MILHVCILQEITDDHEDKFLTIPIDIFMNIRLTLICTTTR